MINKSQNLKQWTRPSDYMGFNPVGDYCIAGQTRDSDALERSNYRTIFQALIDKANKLDCQDSGIDGEGNESDMVYDFRANHWAVGWVEGILICQNAPQALIDYADSIAAALADYPVFDESDSTRMERSEAAEYWERCSVRERAEIIKSHGSYVSIFAARSDCVPEDDGVFEYLTTSHHSLEVMTMTATKQKTCAELVNSAAESRLEDIRVMLSPQESDVTLGDDGTLDTVIYCGDEDLRYSDTSSYRDDDGALDLDAFLVDEFDDIRETMYERFHEYGLAFDYVEPDTFNDQPEGYLRFQISYGGPSEEIRFYVSPAKHGYTMYRAEFWYLDWFDGASVDVTNDATARLLFGHFNDCGSVAYAIETDRYE
jgi:hypothetical protein